MIAFAHLSNIVVNSSNFEKDAVWLIYVPCVVKPIIHSLCTTLTVVSSNFLFQYTMNFILDEYAQNYFQNLTDRRQNTAVLKMWLTVIKETRALLLQIADGGTQEQ